MNRLNHWLYEKETPVDKHLFDDLVRSMEEFNTPCFSSYAALGLVVVLNESRMVELLETERKYKLLRKVLAVLSEEGICR